MTEYSVIWDGLVSGALYGLLGLAYLLILRATRTFNFSVGAFAGFAAVAYANWGADFPLPLAVLMTLSVGALLAIGTDAIVTRPIQAREVGGHLGVVLGLTAALFVIIQITRQVFSARTFLGPPIIDVEIELGSTTIAIQGILSVAAAVVVSLSLDVWQHYGPRGRLLAAVGDNWEAALVLGLPVTGIRYFAVGLAGAVCGLAGLLLSGGGPVNFYSGFGLAMGGFLALVIGGTASNWGPLAGGCVIGLTGTIGARLLGASTKEYVILVVILLVFKLRPQGIFAKLVRE